MKGEERSDLRERTSAKELKPRINTNGHEQPPKRNHGLARIHVRDYKQIHELLQSDKQFEQLQSEVKRILYVKE